MTMALEPARRPATSEPWPLLDDLAYLCSVMVNVYFVGLPHASDREWALIDAGLAGSADRIARAAEERFGRVRSLWCALFERFCHPVSPAEAGVLDGVVAGDRNLLENAVSGRRNGGDYVNHPPARTRQWLTLSNWP